MPRPPVPRLLAISDRHQLPGEELGLWLTALTALAGLAGSPVMGVQIREKDLSDREILGLVRQARRVLPAGTPLLVNGRLDLAIAAGADGVHLPANGLPAEALRRRFGGELLIGVSTHRVEEVEVARRAGADYVTFGPVWATPSKARFGPPPGLEELRRAAAVGLPVLALGGVTIDRAREAAAAGAAGIAAVRMFLRPDKDGLRSAVDAFRDLGSR